VASVRGVRGCHTEGRTVDEARHRIVEALGLFVKNARTATIVDDVKLPRRAAQAIRAYSTLRKKAEQEGRRAAKAARQAAGVLRAGRVRSAHVMLPTARAVSSARAPLRPNVVAGCLGTLPFPGCGPWQRIAGLRAGW
jgi:predicted RNase H-like HicB family nuclease